MWKSWILFLFACLAVLFLVVVYDDNNISFMAIYALLLLLLFCLGTVLAAPSQIEIEEQAGQDCILKNEKFVYSMKITNKGFFFYPRIEYVYHNSGLVHYGEGEPGIDSVGPKSTVAREYMVCIPYRGVYMLGIKSVTVTDFLGLFRRTIPVKEALLVSVYPKSDDSFTLPMPNESQNSVFRNDLYNEDYTSVADVRKYAPSDSFRKVHWKLSAKRNEFMVKNFQSYEQNKTILFLDTKAVPLPGVDKAAFEDKMVSFAASAINYCVRSRLPADFIYGDPHTDHAAIDSLSETDRLYRLLAEISFQSKKSSLCAYCNSMDSSEGSFDMVIFLFNMDGETHDAIKKLVSFDRAISLYYFYSSGLPLKDKNDYFLESLKAYGVAVSKIIVG